MQVDSVEVLDKNNDTLASVLSIFEQIGVNLSHAIFF